MAAVLLTTGLNLAGVRVAARVAAVTVVVEVIALACVLVGGIVVLAQHGPLRGWLTPLTGVHGFSVSAVAGAVSVAVLSYLGFDAIATFAEETRGGGRIIGRATLLCLVVAGLLFAAQTYVGALLSPMSPHELAAHPDAQGSAYYDLVNSQIAHWMSVFLAVAKAVGAAFSAMVAQAAASRILLDMGRSDRLPRLLSRVSGRTGVPWLGLVGVAAVNSVVAVWAAILVAVIVLASHGAQVVGGVWLVLGLVVGVAQGRRLRESTGAGGPR